MYYVALHRTDGTSVTLAEASQFGDAAEEAVRIYQEHEDDSSQDLRNVTVSDGLYAKLVFFFSGVDWRQGSPPARP